MRPEAIESHQVTIKDSQKCVIWFLCLYGRLEALKEPGHLYGTIKLTARLMRPLDAITYEFWCLQYVRFGH